MKLVSYSEEVCITVHDQGSGMPPEVQAFLFKAPQQSTPGTGDEQGHGVGLSLCRSIALQQRSRIWLDNSDHSGCKICFSIPLNDEHQDKIHNQHQ